MPVLPIYLYGADVLRKKAVGSLNRVIVVDISDVEEGKGTKPMVLINPEVFAKEGESSSEEGCLSIPGVRDVVSRPEKVNVRFKDGSFQDSTIEAYGLLGRVIQHEIDHLNGVLITDHFSAVKQRMHKAQLDAIGRGEIEVNYLVVLPETVPK